MIRKTGNIDFRGDNKRRMAYIEQELEMIAADLERTAVEYIEKHNITSGSRQGLIHTIKGLVKKEVDGYRIQVGANKSYAVYVHEGTKPHWAPLRPLYVWAKRKLPVTDNEAWAVAKGTQKKIAREGTKAKPFLAVAIRAHINTISKRIAEAGMKAAQ
jgi:hypothetical protein